MNNKKLLQDFKITFEKLYVTGLIKDKREYDQIQKVIDDISNRINL